MQGSALVVLILTCNRLIVLPSIEPCPTLFQTFGPVAIKAKGLKVGLVVQLRGVLTCWVGGQWNFVVKVGRVCSQPHPTRLAAVLASLQNALLGSL